jgi:hypothetical protein
MAALHGFVLLVTFTCTFITLRHLMEEYLQAQATAKRESGTHRGAWRTRSPSLVAGAVVLALFFIQDRARHQHSPEAKCCQEFERVIGDWESGQERRAMERVRNLAHSVRPWEPADADSDE